MASLIPMLLAQEAEPRELPKTAQEYFAQVHQLQMRIEVLRVEVDQFQTLMYILLVVITLQILFKIGLFVRIGKLLTEARRLLSVTEGHGVVNESIKEQVRWSIQEVVRKAEHAAKVADEHAHAAAGEVKAVLETIPERTAAKVAEVATAAGDSGTLGYLPKKGDSGPKKQLPPDT